MARVAIVIVTYNSETELGACLDALRQLSDVEIVVVDNASGDSSCTVARSRGVRLIENANNRGFAAAVNQGVRITGAPLVLLLNPDAHLMTDLDALTSCFTRSDTGAVGGMLLGADGRAQRGFMARNLPSPTALAFEVLGVNRVWPRNPANRRYRCLELDHTKTVPVEQPAGAFLMFSRAAWEHVGGFDERFVPLWFEDVDFCARLKAAGFLSYYTSGSVARHAGSHSIRSLSLENREQYWYGSLLKYAEKHYCSTVFRTMCAAVALGAAFRALTRFPREGRKAFAVYGGVMGLALNRLLGLDAGVGRVS